MNNIKNNSDIRNLLDGICAVNNWSYSDLGNFFKVTKRTVYLWRLKSEFSNNKSLNEKLQDLIIKSNKGAKELIETGKITNSIKEIPINKIIQFILLNKKITLKQLSKEIEIKRGHLSSLIMKHTKSNSVRQVSNFIAYKIGKYCLEKKFDLDFIKNDFAFEDLRNLNSEELKNLIYGLMKIFGMNTYGFEKYSLKNNTICRWLLGNYHILQYKDVSKLNNLIRNSNHTKEELISIGIKVQGEIAKLSNLLKCTIKTISFKPRTKTEEQLLQALKSNYGEFSIMIHPRIYKDNLRFEPDFIAFDDREVIWFEITDIKETSSYPGNLDMRMLKIKELFNPDKVVLIRKIQQNTNAILRYAKILKLGISFCPISKISGIKGYLTEQDNIIQQLGHVLKNRITSGKDLRFFRIYYLHLSEEQLAAILKIKNKRTIRLERKAKLPDALISEIENLKAIANEKGVKYLHQKSNSHIAKREINDKNIIKFTDFKDELEREIFNLVKQKTNVYHNVMLSNHEASIICEADLYIPDKDLVILCKNSVNPAFGTIHKLIWSLQRFKRIVKNVVFYVPNFPTGKEAMFERNGIIIAKNKKELLEHLSL